MCDRAKRKQKKVTAFGSKENVKNMLSFIERIKKNKINESEEKCSNKSTEKRNKTRSKHIIQNNFTKHKSEEKLVVNEGNKVNINGSKSGKRTKTNNSGRANRKEKKPQNLQGTNFLTYLKNSFRTQILDRGSSSKEFLEKKFSGENAAGGTSNMIFVSLDFIEDCQNYKKKFIKPLTGQELKTSRKNLENISSYHKRYLNERAQTPKFQKIRKTYEEILPCKDLMQKKSTEITPKNQVEEGTHESFPTKHSSIAEKINADVKMTPGEADEVLKDESSDQWGKLSTETFSVNQSIIVKPSSEDVSTVDKKYIELLLSIANCNETKQNMNVKNNESKDIERDNCSKQWEKKTKIKGKTFFENKIKKEKMENHHVRNEENIEKIIASENKKKSDDENGAPVASQENTVFARLVRDLTKSEIQILPQKRKNPHRGRYSEIEGEKKAALSKPEVNDNRKKRKTRNNVLKNNNEDFIELPYSCEMSNVADVKELWKRGTPEKSENSISSCSSSTMHENEEIKGFKSVGLESYKILRKIVEEEIKTICKKFTEENTENLDTNLCGIENEQMDDKEHKELKSVCKELRNIIFENAEETLQTRPTKIDEISKKIYKEEEKPNTNCEEKNEKDDLLKYLDKHETKDLDPDLLKGKKKLPSQMIKNWSILHRLEQAFLALGTPTFPNRDKFPNSLKVTDTSNTKKSSEDVKIQEKGLHRNKDILGKKGKKTPTTANSANPKNQRDASETRNLKLSSAKTVLQNSRNKKAESDSKQPLPNDKTQGIKNSRNGTKQTGVVVQNTQKIAEAEDKLMQKKGKSQGQRPNISETKKSPLRSLARPKVCDFESRYSKRDMKQKKFKHNTVPKNSFSAKTKSWEAKAAELRRKKPSKTLVCFSNRKDNENLERKETFDVIPLKASSKIKVRKSKSCNKIDDSLEFDNAKKRFPPTRSIDSKNLNFWSPEVNPNANNKMKPPFSQRTSGKDKSPQPQERPNTVSEKDYFKGNRDNLKDRFSQDKKYEKVLPADGTPQQILLRKETPKWKDRAVKERSILSMRGNQSGNQDKRKCYIHLREKTVCNPSAEPKPSKPVKNVPLLEENNPKDVNILLDMCAEINTPDSISFSCVSTCTFDVSDCVDQENSKFPSQIVTSSLNEFEILEELSSLSSLSFSTLEQQQIVESTHTNADIKSLRGQPLWEYDIKQYRAIVREIMSQYKRIDGFLKENEHSQSFLNYSVNVLSKEEEIGSKSSKLSKNLQDMSIHEYRKKILSEYQALPSFEYKTKIQEEGGNNKPEERRRNLSFVKALKTEMDVDVKDFQPNVQKILDSQLYVDMENIFKRNEPYVKFNEKKSSLQEITLSKSKKTVTEEECQRCISTPKTFLSLPRTPTYSSSMQNLPLATSSSDSFGINTLV